MSTLTTIISLVALIIYMYIFAYGGMALDEMMSYEQYFKENIVKLWVLLFLLLFLTFSSIINLIVIKKKSI